MKEIVKLMLVGMVLAGAFVGLMILSNYLHYGTFLF